MKLLQSPYIRLMRLHQPTGIWLLLWPCWWSVAMASYGSTPMGTLFLFAVGAIVMRAAGCIINDLADQDIDKEVARTRTRPLASGEISRHDAILCMLILLSIGLLVGAKLGPKTLIVASVSVILVALYPYMKRITWWPQLFLGITFNWGALVGWVAVRGTLEWPALVLYGAGIFWTLGYDTIYAHQDKEDDARLGIKSTALKFGSASKEWISSFYFGMLVLLVITGWGEHLGWPYYLSIFATAIHMGWQVGKLDLNNPDSCLKIFKSNAKMGLILFLGIVLARTIA